MSNLSPDSIDEKGVRHFKILAKRLRKETGCKSTAALDQIAQAHGFKNWNNVLRFAQKNQASRFSSLHQENQMNTNPSNESQQEIKGYDPNEVIPLDLTKTLIPANSFGSLLPLLFEVGRRELPLNEILQLKVGSVIELHKYVGEDLEVILADQVVAGGMSVAIEHNLGVQILQVGSFQSKGSYRLDSKKGLTAIVTVEIGRRLALVEKIMQLKPGAVIPFDKPAGSPMDIRIGGHLVAQGETVVLKDKYGVRIDTIIPFAGKNW